MILRIITFLFTLHSLNAQSLQTDLSLKYLSREPIVKSTHTPILLLLHGLGSNENDLIALASHLPKQMQIVSVQAPITLSQNSFAWFHVDLSRGTPIYKGIEAEKSRTLLLTFIEELKHKYKTNEIYLIGFSQGAILSFSVALTHPEKVNGVVALSGRILPDIQPQLATPVRLKKLRLFIGHGVNDHVLPLDNAKATYNFCKEADVSFTYKEYPIGHEISENELKDILDWFESLK
ncbi:MAG: alpha/beta fold hydrolase [Bacteroidia bacterium]|nr:alpha/beta fold hydrolase [Bacteroidia bacterium]